MPAYISTDFATKRLARWLTLLLSAAFCSSAIAGPPETLLRYVPEDVGFCLVVRELRERSHDLMQSPLAKKIGTSPNDWLKGNPAELAKLSGIEQELKKHFDLDWAKIRDELVGDAVVFAYRPGPPGKMQDESGLLLIHARDPKALADLIERINVVQKGTGDLKELKERTHNGNQYVCRVEKDKETFYHLDGAVFIFATQELGMRRALDQERQTPAASEPPLSRQLRLLGIDQHFLSLWLNPRVFQTELEAKAASNDESGGVVRRFLTYWKAIDSIGLSAQLETDFRLRLAVRSRPDALPAAGRRFLVEAGKPSELWAYFPDDAMVACAGRIDLSALVKVVAAFLPEAARTAAGDQLQRSIGSLIGRDLAKEVAPAIGPEVGFYLASPPAAYPAWVPRALFALRVQSGENKMDQAIYAALHPLALMAVLGYNQKHADQVALKTLEQDKQEVKFLANETGFPAGLQPAYALKNGYILLTSSPGVIREFGLTSRRATPSGESPLLRISFNAIRAYVTARHDSLAKFFVAQHRISEAEAKKQLDELLKGIENLDRVEITQYVTSGQTTFTLRVQTTLPLK